MKKFAAFALVLLVLAPVLSAQAATAFTAKWVGTYTIQNEDGTERPPQAIEFDLTQKGAVLTGKAGPANDQSPLTNGAVKAGKATFDVQTPGPLFKFTLTIVKGRLQGEMTASRDGVVRGHAKVDAAKAAK